MEVWFWKYIVRPFYWCQKIVEKWWLSRSYLELKKAQILRGKLWGSFSYCHISTSCLNIIENGNVFLKVHSQAFLLVPKNCQKVMVIKVIWHLKSRLTFVRALSMGGFDFSAETVPFVWPFRLFWLGTVPLIFRSVRFGPEPFRWKDRSSNGLNGYRTVTIKTNGYRTVWTVNERSIPIQ